MNALQPEDEVLYSSQEAARAVGYSSAALPLWEEFFVLYFPLQPQLQDVLPLGEISQHLAQLGQLYEAQSPLLASCFTIMAPVSKESLPGETVGLSTASSSLNFFNAARDIHYLLHDLRLKGMGKRILLTAKT